jgi:urease accessory protein
MDPRLLQLADSAFPSGAFTHSGGLEALRQLGLLTDENLPLRLRELVWSTAIGALPFVNDAHLGDARAADRDVDRFLSGEIANRASRAQGRSFLIAAAATLADDAVEDLRRGLPWSHLTAATGAAMRIAGVSLDDTRRLFLYGAVRGALSAAVRLGVTGPLHAQQVLYRLHGPMDEALLATRALTSSDATMAAPLVEVVQGAQDRLYSRLFQS